MTAKDFWDNAEIISIYTDEQAVEDGVLISVCFGSITRITRTILEDYMGEDRIEEFILFINEIMAKFAAERKLKKDWFYAISLEGRKYYIVNNGTGFTLMKPKDY